MNVKRSNHLALALAIAVVAAAAVGCGGDREPEGRETAPGAGAPMAVETATPAAGMMGTETPVPGAMETGTPGPGSMMTGTPGAGMTTGTPGAGRGMMSGQAMTGAEMVRHMEEMHGRVLRMRQGQSGVRTPDSMVLQHMDEMSESMRRMATTMDRMSEGHALTGDPALRQHLDQMREHMSLAMEDYRQMLETMERGGGAGTSGTGMPGATATP